MKKITRRSYLKQAALAVAAGSLPGLLRPRGAFAQVAAPAPAPEPAPTQGERAAMAAAAQAFMDTYQVPGFSVAIARHGQFVYQEGFGLADKDNAERVTPAHLFRIASVSKPITSIAIFTLIEQGKLGLDNLVFGPQGLLGFDYGKSYPDPVGRITLHHLLTHTCGGWEKGAKDPMFHNPGMGHTALITWTLANVPLDYEPGTHCGYSNFGYCILGRVLEKLTGMPYAAFTQQSVLGKCGIKDMQVAGNLLAERAPGEVVYYGQNGENPYNMDVRRMDSHGGWIATASDLVRVLMHVDGFNTTANILKPKTIETMSTPGALSPGYACGWCVNKAPNRWHNGSLPGTTTIMARTASGMCWAGLTNTRTKEIDLALDQTMWKMTRAVPEWHS